MTKRNVLFRGAMMLLLVLLYVPAWAQTNIAGYVNRYWAVSGISGTTITLDASSAMGAAHTLVANDKVLIIQMKGAVINTDGTINSSAIGYAGNYEYATVQSATTSSVTLTAPLTNSYNASQSVQLVWVPVYNNVNTISYVTCMGWNGKAGGILAFDANNITMNYDISVQGNGFGGGLALEDNDGVQCSSPTTTIANNQNVGGAKGEGISTQWGAVSTVGNNVFARSPYANGGGGGNTHNAGGAGGSNGGNGGRGGDDLYFPSQSCVAEPVGGIPASAINYTSIDASNQKKAFLGGGGGAGHRDSGGSAHGMGGRGGGIIMINANSLTVNGGTINANGSVGSTILKSNGGGGGGGGGTIILNICTYTTPVTVTANGGPGSSITELDAHPVISGPGGGGGGGIIRFGGKQPVGTVTVSGGAAGFSIDNPDRPQTNHNAQAGTTGVIKSASIDVNIASNICLSNNTVMAYPIFGGGIFPASIFVEVWDSYGNYYIGNNTWVPYTGGGINLYQVAQSLGNTLPCGVLLNVKLAVTIPCYGWFEKVKQFTISCPPPYNTAFNDFVSCNSVTNLASITVTPSYNYGSTTSNIWVLSIWNGSAYVLSQVATSANNAGHTFTNIPSPGQYMVTHIIQNNSSTFCNQAAPTIRYPFCGPGKTSAPELSDEEIAELLSQISQFSNGTVIDTRAAELLVYPNPTNGITVLEVNGAPQGDLSITVMDYTGKTVKSETANADNGTLTHQLTTDGLPAGMYLIMVRSQGELLAQTKLVKY